MAAPEETTTSGYLPIGELAMFYTSVGAGEPLVLLHGGLTTFASSFVRVLPELVNTRRVIGLEQQAHGHTADLDRPLRFATMVADTAAAFTQLGLANADVWGYSDGGILALGLAIHHPALVRSLTLVGVNFNNDGLQPGMLDVFARGRADDLPPAMRDDYVAAAPHPAQWPTLVAKVMDLALTFPGWPAADLRRITAPTLIVTGDTDIATPEHGVALFRLLPAAQLAILPGTDHVALMTGDQAAWTLAMFQAFQAKLTAERSA